MFSVGPARGRTFGFDGLAWFFNNEPMPRSRVLLVPVVVLAACFSPTGADTDATASAGTGTGTSTQGSTTTGTTGMTGTTVGPTATAGSTVSEPTSGGTTGEPSSTSSGQTATSTGEPSTTTSTSGGGAVCGNMIIESGEECDDANSIDTDDCTNACKMAVCGDGIVLTGSEECDGGEECNPDTCLRTYLRVFVTSEPISAEFKGLGPADAHCDVLAEAGGQKGTYKAWLSSKGESPATRFVQSTRPWRIQSGSVIADDWNDLIDGEIKAPIDVDEMGNPLNLPISCGQCPVWTATTFNGTALMSDCVDWSQGNLALVQVGECKMTNASWTDGCPETECATSARLYCFEQGIKP